MGGPKQLHPLVSWICSGRGDNGLHGKKLTVQTETTSYHSLIVEAHGVNVALLLDFGTYFHQGAPHVSSRLLP